MLLQMRDATCITVSHTPIMTALTQKAISMAFFFFKLAEVAYQFCCARSVNRNPNRKEQRKSESGNTNHQLIN